VRTSDFQPGDLLIVDDLEGVADHWKGALLRNPALIDTFRQDQKRVTILFLKRVEYAAYDVNITTYSNTINATTINFGAVQQLSSATLWLEIWDMFESLGMHDVISFIGIPCLARVFRAGQEIHRCLTTE